MISPWNTIDNTASPTGNSRQTSRWPRVLRWVDTCTASMALPSAGVTLALEMYSHEHGARWYRTLSPRQSLHPPKPKTERRKVRPMMLYFFAHRGGSSTRPAACHVRVEDTCTSTSISRINQATVGGSSEKPRHNSVDVSNHRPIAAAPTQLDRWTTT